MVRIAIVDDEREAAEALDGMISRFAEEAGVAMDTILFSNAVLFLTNYQANYDIVFMDIEMPYLNGMEGAERMRGIDHTTLLIFATNLGHMAAMGYSLCNNCYLVNLRFVRRVEKYTVTVGNDVLQISRPRKKAFLQALNDYIGG